MTAYDPAKHHRQSLRLREYDYARAGCYFVTVCTRDRRRVFGEIERGRLQPSEAGAIVATAWQDLPVRFATVALDERIVMPDHIHGLIVLDEEGSARVRPPLGEVVRAFKATAARRLHLAGFTDFAWQRNYYEHIVRTEPALAQIRQYIIANPATWVHDPDQERLDVT